MADGASDHSAKTLIALASTLLSIGLVTVILRFYARYRQKVPLGIDDWLTLPALFSFAGVCAGLYYGIHIKFVGYLSTDFSKEYFQDILEQSVKTQTAQATISLFCLAFTKASALFFYKRIFCVSGRKATLNLVIVGSLIVLAIWLVIFAFLTVFQCRGHFSAGWDGTKIKYCTLSYPSMEGGAISDMILDVWVLVLPVYPIMKLQTTKSRKFAIGGIFLLACIGLGCSIARVVMLLNLVNVGQAKVNKTDPELYKSRITFYYTLEMGISVIAINLPSIWLVFASVAPSAILRSIRSVVSLVSVRSRGSQDSRGERSTQHRSKAEHLKSTSTSSIVPISGSSAEVEAYELGHSGSRGAGHVPPWQIQVDRSVQQTSKPRQYEEV